MFEWGLRSKHHYHQLTYGCCSSWDHNSFLPESNLILQCMDPTDLLILFHKKCKKKKSIKRGHPLPLVIGLFTYPWCMKKEFNFPWPKNILLREQWTTFKIFCEVWNYQIFSCDWLITSGIEYPLQSLFSLISKTTFKIITK